MGLVYTMSDSSLHACLSNACTLPLSPARTGLLTVPRSQAPVTVSIVSGTRIRRVATWRIVQ